MMRKPFGISPACWRWNMPGRSLRLARSPVAPKRTMTWSVADAVRRPGPPAALAVVTLTPRRLQRAVRGPYAWQRCRVRPTGGRSSIRRRWSGPRRASGARSGTRCRRRSASPKACGGRSSGRSRRRSGAPPRTRGCLNLILGASRADARGGGLPRGGDRLGARAGRARLRPAVDPEPAGRRRRRRGARSAAGFAPRPRLDALRPRRPPAALQGRRRRRGGRGRRLRRGRALRRRSPRSASASRAWVASLFAPLPAPARLALLPGAGRRRAAGLRGDAPRRRGRRARDRGDARGRPPARLPARAPAPPDRGRRRRPASAPSSSRPASGSPAAPRPATATSSAPASRRPTSAWLG